MVNEKTIIFYSANTDCPAFEQLIVDDLKKKAGDIPIISITHKPMDLGTNICVGVQPHSYTNEWRQLLIGLRAAKTKFCMTAESDCLYPEDYFAFTPPVDDMIYYYENLWMVWKRHNGFWQKTGHCEGAEICGREYWLTRMEPIFGKDLGTDWEPKTRKWENDIIREFFPKCGTFSGNPMISFKTGSGVSTRTTFKNKKVHTIPYWGDIAPLKQKYFKSYI